MRCVNLQGTVIGFSPEERNALLNFIKNKIRKR